MWMSWGVGFIQETTVAILGFIFIYLFLTGRFLKRIKVQETYWTEINTILKTTKGCS